MSTAKEALRIKRSHHLWSAEKDEAGKIKVNRSAAEKEEWETMENTRTASRKEADRETVNALWGLFGASLVDSAALTSTIPARVAKQFNTINPAPAPEVKTWDEIRKAFGSEIVNDIRKAVAHGIKIRLASKFMDVPFILATDIVNALPAVDLKHAKIMVEGIKNGDVTNVVKTYGQDAVKVAKLFEEFKSGGMPRIAIDDSARKLFKSYWGPFGEELCREIKMRVRSDLASRWLRKFSVDQSASEYWGKFFGSYGDAWVKYVPKLLRPTK